MRMIWLSDIHLEFLTSYEAIHFLKRVADKGPDLILITGDISNALSLAKHLKFISEFLPKTLFLTGNHDFYHGSFEDVKQTIRQFCESHPSVVELGHGEILRLSNDTMLIGTSGWGDGRAGRGASSKVRLSDSLVIKDLVNLETVDLFHRLAALGDESARYILDVGRKALSTASHLVVATHVPPFCEAALYRGHPSSLDHAPFFVNQVMGEALLKLASENPSKQITVLCGHTHAEANVLIVPNLRVMVAGASYNFPQIAKIFAFGGEEATEIDQSNTAIERNQV